MTLDDFAGFERVTVNGASYVVLMQSAGIAYLVSESDLINGMEPLQISAIKVQA